MLNVGGWEVLIIFLVALLVLGPERLPDAAKQAGRVFREFRRISSGFQRELNEAMKDPVKAAGLSTDVTVDAKNRSKAASDPFAAKKTSLKPASDASADSEVDVSDEDDHAVEAGVEGDVDAADIDTDAGPATLTDPAEPDHALEPANEGDDADDAPPEVTDPPMQSDR